MNNTERTLEHLKTFGSITSMDAFAFMGNTRLADTIYRLRKKGYDIESVDETSVNRYGDKVTYARYKLREEDDK